MLIKMQLVKSTLPKSIYLTLNNKHTEWNLREIDNSKTSYERISTLQNKLRNQLGLH